MSHNHGLAKGAGWGGPAKGSGSGPAKGAGKGVSCGGPAKGPGNGNPVKPFVKDDPRQHQGRRALLVATPDGRQVTLGELSREATWEAVQTLRSCVNDAKQEMNVRCRAAGYLLQLGWGSAPKEATLRLVSNNTLAGMTDAELIQHAMERFGNGGMGQPVIDLDPESMSPPDA